jgi:hypothetical protein
LKAFYLLFNDFQRVLGKRRLIQQRRRVDDAYLNQWFRFDPVSLPLEGGEKEPASVPVAER